MSRIGKKPIILPQEVEVKRDGNSIVVKGPRGELKREIRPEIITEIKDNVLLCSPIKENRKNRSFWGLTRTLISNMIEGVTQGYTTRLQIEGIGYKAISEGKDLTLHLGFSHPIRVIPENGITFSIEKNIIVISGINKELVTQTAAKIRKIKPPEPYKGKGIRYEGEVVKKKVGKKAAGAKK